MFYCSMHMPMGWEGLSMPTDGCSVCIPIIIINSKLRGAKQHSVQYMVKVILTHIAFECGVVDPYVDSLIVLVKQWSSLPVMVKLSRLILCPEMLLYLNQ